MEIGTALSTELDLTALLERVLRETTQLAHCDGGVLYLLDKAGERLRPEIIRWHGHLPVDERFAPPSLSLEGGVLLPQTVEALNRGRSS